VAPSDQVDERRHTIVSRENVGITQSWRAALIGTAVALALLTVLVLIFGPLLTTVPLVLLQFIVGSLLILFGMRWLRKAILRSVGVLALRDEAKNFAKETAELERHKQDRRADYLAGLAAFKAVLLEGTEVVFIVIAVGSTRGLTLYAGLGALVAFLLVLAIGLIVHKPLSRVPENGLKYAGGLMLTSFGIFWTGEGLGTDWPGGDLSLLEIFVVVTATALALTQLLRADRAPVRKGLTP
jgi:uncharacterized membrane protein